MLVSQFQAPFHFLMTYLEDFKMDPGSAQPLLTFSVFDDLSESQDLTLVRADVLTKGIQDDEGLKIVKNMVDVYVQDDEYMNVRAFNTHPDSFNVDDYIASQKEKWKREE
jgi:ATP synthase F1 complex assembly factor 1